MDMLENIPAGCIAAIIPEYEPNTGNVTRILDVDGNEYKIYKRVKTILKKLGRIYAIDLPALRLKYAPILNQQNVIPLPFNENVILIPIKMRKPIAENDGSLGYVNLSMIEKIQKKKDNNYAEIILSNALCIQSIVNYSTACKHIKNAQIVKQHYLKLHGKIPNHHKVEELYSQYQQLATKNDIAILNDQIAELKHYIKKTIFFSKE
ncbi:hypothetical protein [Petroclostridium sp. X23]|uniref:hypothetical protein n=1 Tax=Petroclostridium sp. X23 TaxID=3045146 RepID=UPI0024AD18E2|nr:hypothetical protein [Petroclostridium sp. X23]WHH59561.1 hypothetical protein QKW49_02010 [Petroclostridium sp. X23]